MGTAFANLLQTYTPGIWDHIVDTVGPAFQAITNAVTPQAQGTAQQNAAKVLTPTPQQTNLLEDDGGDDQVTQDWMLDMEDSTQGGGGGNDGGMGGGGDGGTPRPCTGDSCDKDNS